MKRLLLSLVLAALLIVPAAHAGALDLFSGFKGSGGCGGSAQGSVVCDADGKNPISGTDGILHKVTNFIAMLAGIVSVILIMISGFQFITSGGDSGKIASARNALVGAIVGVLIVVFAQAILIFVLKGV